MLLNAFPGARQVQPAIAAAASRCHDQRYLDALAGLTEPTWIEYPSTIASQTSWEAALLAAGGAIAAAEQGAFALVRPPGHHAPSSGAYGFCLLDNVAIAARHMQAEHGVERIAIVDWDVHHGNGTQDIFWEDESVLFVSLHQAGIFPGTGGADEQTQTVVNVPLPAGSGDAEYLEAFGEIVEPAVRRFDPQLLLVSAGFDAHEEEDLYLVDMRVSTTGFHELARRCASLAPRVGAVLEGGYNLETLPRLVEAALEGFDAERATAG